MTIDRPKLVLCLLYIALLLISAFLRWSGVEGNQFSSFEGLATPLYIGSTVFVAVMLMRSGNDLRTLAFRGSIQIKHIAVGFAGAIGIILLSAGLDQFVDLSRDVSRFDGIENDVSTLMKLLIFSWVFAALGEEIAFRLVLMQGVCAALGQTRSALLLALIVQAVVFGLVHLYQGPAGMFGTTLNALIYGGLVLWSRGSILPSFVAHGTVNTIGLLTLYACG